MTSRRWSAKDVRCDVVVVVVVSSSCCWMTILVVVVGARKDYFCVRLRSMTAMIFSLDRVIPA